MNSYSVEAHVSGDYGVFRDNGHDFQIRPGRLDVLGGGYAVLADDLKETKSKRLARKSREEGTERQQEESTFVH